MKHSHYKRGEKRKIILWLFTAAVIFFMVFFLMYIIESSHQKVSSRELDTLNRSLLKQDRISYGNKEYIRKKNVRSYLLLGTDLSDKADANQGFVDNGFTAKMADAIYLIVIDDDECSYEVLQLDRNTITGIHILDAEGNDILTSPQQLCTAYFYGQNEHASCENTLLAVSELLNNVEIDGYAAFTIDFIPFINEKAGGVSVTIEDDLSDQDPELIRGASLTLNNKQAEIYVRSRMYADNGSNRARLDRQSDFITSLMEQIRDKASLDGSFLSDLYNDAFLIMTTNLGRDDFVSIAAKLPEYENKGIITLEGSIEAGSTLDDGRIHEEFYPDESLTTETVLNLYYKEK